MSNFKFLNTKGFKVDIFRISPIVVCSMQLLILSSSYKCRDIISAFLTVFTRKQIRLVLRFLCF